MDSLSVHEADAWARMWACHMQLPSNLDARLKRDANVTYFEFRAMLKISENPNASRRMTDLSEATSMSLSHLSRVITRLEKKGFVARIPDPNDGRATFAALTPAGQRAVSAGRPATSPSSGGSSSTTSLTVSWRSFRPRWRASILRCRVSLPRRAKPPV